MMEAPAIDTREKPGKAPKISPFVKLTLTLRELIAAANLGDSPIASHLLVRATPSGRKVVEGAVVVLRGRETVEVFEQWAARNNIKPARLGAGEGGAEP